MVKIYSKHPDKEYFFYYIIFNQVLFNFLEYIYKDKELRETYTKYPDKEIKFSIIILFDFIK